MALSGSSDAGVRQVPERPLVIARLVGGAGEIEQHGHGRRGRGGAVEHRAGLGEALVRRMWIAPRRRRMSAVTIPARSSAASRPPTLVVLHVLERRRHAEHVGDHESGCAASGRHGGSAAAASPRRRTATAASASTCGRAATSGGSRSSSARDVGELAAGRAKQRRLEQPVGVRRVDGEQRGVDVERLRARGRVRRAPFLVEPRRGSRTAGPRAARGGWPA